MILLISAIVLFILLGIVPHILHCFWVNKHYYIYDEKGEYTQSGSEIDKWPNGKPEDFNSWKSYPCRKTTKICPCEYDWEIDECIGPWLGTAFTFIPLFVAVIIAGMHNSPWEIEREANSITEHIVRLETNRDNLLSYYNNSIAKDIDISSTNLPGKINEHNAEVEEFVVKLKSEKVNLTNPWINVFYNPAYKNIDIPRVEATYINLN